jgi:spore photoproduct lyase
VTVSTRGFRRLVISDHAARSPLGRRLATAFHAAGCAVSHCDEAELDGLATVGSLLCGYRPPRGWIERAEHGALAVREHEYYVSPIVGCRSRCTYCFLQASSLRVPLRVYAGVDSLLAEVNCLLDSLPRSVEPLLCTGEYADSLADSDLYPVAALLVEQIAERSRGSLELRTKSAKVDSLLGLDHRDRTVVAFSLSPQEAVSRYEGGTASIDARLAAARRCQDHGYRVALKLEPLHIGPGWLDRYSGLVSHVAAALDPRGVAHVSVGSLRASDALLHKPTFKRHHEDALRAGEAVAYRPSVSNTMPSRADRLTAYRYVREVLIEEGINSPVWWSMETPEVIAALNDSLPIAPPTATAA